jgi:hypothetical protein
MVRGIPLQQGRILAEQVQAAGELPRSAQALTVQVTTPGLVAEGQARILIVQPTPV